jgi:hypothetical protein
MMKNLNEPLREPEDIRTDNRETNPRRSEADVVSLEQHRANAGRAEGSLIPTRQIEELRARWTTIQSGFVDEPRQAVQDADELVSSAIKQIAEGFRDQRQLRSSGQQKRCLTEDLRVSPTLSDIFDACCRCSAKGILFDRVGGQQEPLSSKLACPAVGDLRMRSIAS